MHGTAPEHANLDKVNPRAVGLSGKMMLCYLGWIEAADLILKGMDGAIGGKTMAYDFARLMFANSIEFTLKKKYVSWKLL